MQIDCVFFDQMMKGASQVEDHALAWNVSSVILCLSLKFN